MKSEEVILFVPGSGENLESRNYVAVLNAFKEKGYRAIFVPIKWSRTTINSWVNQLEDLYKEYDSRDVILAGFSFGAMTAFIAASHRSPAELWLCSMSSYFGKEEIARVNPKFVKTVGERKLAAFEKLNFDQLVRTISSKTLIFLGEHEQKLYPILYERAEKTVKALSGSRLVIAHGVEHDIAAPEYISAIIRAI